MILASAERIATYTAQGWWGSQTLGGLFLDRVLEHPERCAVVDAPNAWDVIGQPAASYTWAQLADAASRTLCYLHAQGLRKDDVVVMQAPNCIQMHAVYLACAMGGFIVSPLPVQYRAHEFERVLSLTQARHVIVAERAGKVALPWLWEPLQATHGLRLHNLHTITKFEQTLPVDGLRLWMERIALQANDIYSVCWTSGTEAQPKGVPRSHNEWILGGRSVAEAAELPDGAQLLIPFPFVNMAGLSSSLIAWLDCGGTLHHHHPFDLGVFLKQLREQPIDYTVAAPAVLTQLIQQPEQLEGIDFSRLRRVGSGGSPVSPWLIRSWAEKFGVDVINYFGSNEGAALTATAREIPDAEERARFFPRWGIQGFSWTMSNAQRIETRLIDVDTGERIESPGRLGELRFRGPTIISEYFRSPEQTARAFDEDGFYCTGDLFEIAGDQGQYYRYGGRHKDIVIRGGMNISCEEVEQLLLGHPQVKEVAVVGWPDPVLGERVCAVVVPAPQSTPTLEALVKHLAQVGQVAAFKWPEKLVVQAELPRNALGKILKRELRSHLLRMAQESRA